MVSPAKTISTAPVKRARKFNLNPETQDRSTRNKEAASGFKTLAVTVTAGLSRTNTNLLS
jgi:hypothetical protein